MSNETYMGRPLSELSRDELVYAVIHLGKLLRSSDAPIAEPPFPVPRIPEVPLRRCLRCGERVRVEGETILCDGVVSKLAPLSVHEVVSTMQSGREFEWHYPEVLSEEDS